jgi:hypothetical protein
MADALPPFSARNRRDTAQIDGEVPESARVGLMHIVAEAVRNDHIKDWNCSSDGTSENCATIGPN